MSDSAPILPPSAMPLARELGERLGGDPWCKPIPELQPITDMPRRLNPEAWPEEARAEIQAIYEGKE